MVNRTVKQALYQLKRQFGVVLTLYQVTVRDVVNDFTGQQNVDTAAKEIRAILLPVGYKIHEQLDRGASSRYSGDIHVGDRELIIDQKYTVKIGDYFTTTDGKKYNVIDLADFEAGAYFALIRNTQNESVA